MMMFRPLMFALVTSACVSPPDAEVAVVQAVDSSNGTSLNGTSLNGTSLNGTSLNGTSLNGTSLNGQSLNGTSLNGTSLNGTSLNGTSVAGSTWTGVASNGATVNLRIDAATAGSGSNADVAFFTVSYQTTTAWAPLCGVDVNNVAIAAIAVPGLWDAKASYAPSSTSFTFACRFKSVAKCVELGYKPWSGYADHMAACVRLLRADYCGDGKSHTVDGTLINLYDNVGIQYDTESWQVEAAWTPDGAACVNSNNAARFELAMQNDPACLQNMETSTCGKFTPGVLLIDELSPCAVTRTQTRN